MARLHVSGGAGSPAVYMCADSRLAVLALLLDELVMRHRHLPAAHFPAVATSFFEFDVLPPPVSVLSDRTQHDLL